MATIVNLTPHDLNIVLSDGTIHTIPKSGQVARVAVNRVPYDPINGIVPVSLTTYGEVEGLPPSDHHDKVYVVSALVAARCPERVDVFSPGELVRDGDGNVIGCRGLSCA